MADDPPNSHPVGAPPISHSSSAANRIGLVQDFTQFGVDNMIDAAVCAPDPGVTFPIASILGQTISAVWDPSIYTGPLEGRAVWRLNQQGQRVDGQILYVDSQTIDFLDGLPDVCFNTIIRYQAPNTGGDSGGAVIETLTGNLMGLHFAGDSGNQSFFCLASLIFQTLNIKLT
jgi:hypothetical protein